MRFPLVLLYHIILPPPPRADLEESKLFLHPDRFVAQMEDLKSRGFHTLTLTEFHAAVASDKPARDRFLLTFDDAYAHVQDAVTPTLRRLGLSAVMFAPWAHLGGRNVWDNQHPNLARLDILSVPELRTLDAGPWEVASHGMRHLDLTTLTQGERLADLMESRAALSDILGHPILDLAYPYGAWDESVANDVAEAGYRAAFVALPSPSNSVFQTPRQPIRGDEGMTLFRLRTSPAGHLGYGLGGLAPQWVRTAARAILR